MGEIAVIGIGYEAGQLTLEAVERLRSGAKVILHTGRCGCADWLRQQGIEFSTLDGLYESCEDFDDHARAAAQAVRDAARDEDVVYGVFDVRDASVSRLLDEVRDARVIPGPPSEGPLFARAQGSVQMMAASDWESAVLSSGRSILIRELDSRQLASEVKLKLMDVYPDESAVYILLPGGMAQTKLYNLDRMKQYDHRTCALVAAEEDLTNLERFDFERLCQVIAILCGPDGCPWDRAQTHRSLRPYIIEEAYEVVGAIDEEDPDHLCDELGDMLLQVVLHAQIARQHGEFAIGDVISAISEKMIRRHSHIFGKDRVRDAGEVNGLWSRNKMAERGQTTRTETLKDVARSLPATLRAVKVLKRLDEACGQEETLRAAAARARRAAEALDGASDAERALGEALLSLSAAARAGGVDPEIALNAAVDRLIGRFDRLETQLRAKGGSMESVSPEILHKYWDLVKLSDSAADWQE